MAEENGKESAPTRRVVLKRERVVILPVNFDPGADKHKEGLKLLGGTIADAWTVVGEFEGASKTHAIEAHAGKPGTPDAKPGAYKAPTVSAWNGGELYEAPPAPLVQRRALEDA